MSMALMHPVKPEALDNLTSMLLCAVLLSKRGKFSILIFLAKMLDTHIKCVEKLDERSDSPFLMLLVN